MTREDALKLFQTPTPDETARAAYAVVDRIFPETAEALFNELQDGPGKTVAIRKLQDAYLSAKACIANEGK